MNYYSIEDFKNVKKIDAHVHINTFESVLPEQAAEDHFKLVTINVDAYEDPIEKQQEYAVSLRDRFPGRLVYLTTFRVRGFEQAGWEDSVLSYLKKSFEKGAVGAKVWKNIGMDEITSEGRAAIRTMPKRVFQTTGEDIIKKLQARRNSLPEYTKELYLTLAKNVDVVGTDQKEMYEVERLQNGNTSVEVYGLSNDDHSLKDLLYHREFKLKETKEIRLYGLSGEDRFNIRGKSEKGIRIRVIGGKGSDVVIDSSSVRGVNKKTIVYDRKDKKNTIIKGSETKLKLSKDKSVNEYNRKLFKYNRIIPIVRVGYNIDDGVFLGGGAGFYNYHFRDSTVHTISGSIAVQTGAFIINYQGIYSSVSRIFHLIIDAKISFPKNVDNFYGIGNESVKQTNDKTYYRVRYNYAYLNPKMHRQVNDHLSFAFGTFYQYFQVNDTTERFIGDMPKNMLDSSAYDAHHFTGLNANLVLDTRDNKILPLRGIVLNAGILGLYGLNKQTKNFIKLKTDFSYYLSFRKDPRIVFAFRAGGAANFGNYEFYHANFLGRGKNLRGYRSNRYAGDISFYQNTELRVKLLNLKTSIFNGQAGFILFNDVGRVWVKGEDSKSWHDGYGGGLWISPFNYVALTLIYGRSKEDSMINFNFHYFF